MAVSTNPVALDETLQATNEKLNDIKEVLETANFGRGIDSITKTSTSGLVDTYTIEYTDDTSTTYNVTNGRNGTDGVDGVSPSANVSKVGNTATITIVDGSGTTTATVTDGTNGTDGFSPIANVEKVDGVATITVIDKLGTTTATVSDGTDGQDGQDGQDGEDGFSPIANVEKMGSVATITITDAEGTTTATISDGADGTDGEDGADGTSLTATSSKSGKVTTVLIKNAETEETLTTLTINDGADGQGSGDMTKAVYDTDNDGVVDSAETLDGLTATVTELNYMDGVTSNVQTQIDSKVDQVTGKGLSSNDYTTAEKTKLSGIAEGAEVNAIISADSDFSIANKVLSLASAVKTKLNNFDISGSLTTALSGKANTSTTYTKSEVDSALNNKANTSALDTWTSQVSLASGNTFTFSGLNTSYNYKLFCDAPNAYITSIAQNGSTLVYTMGGSGLLVGTTKGKLRIIK